MFGYFKRQANRRKAQERAQKKDREKVQPSPPAIYINTHRRNKDSDHIENIIGSDSDIFSDFKVLTTEDISTEDLTQEDAAKVGPVKSALFLTIILSGLAVFGWLIVGGAISIFQTIVQSVFSALFAPL